VIYQYPNKPTQHLRSNEKSQPWNSPKTKFYQLGKQNLSVCSFQRKLELLAGI
jgi:hypothetical protein